jgi:hypothetical protein
MVIFRLGFFTTESTEFFCKNERKIGRGFLKGGLVTILQDVFGLRLQAGKERPISWRLKYSRRVRRVFKSQLAGQVKNTPLLMRQRRILRTEPVEMITFLARV